MECLQASAAAVVSTAADAASRATAVPWYQQGRIALPDLAPGDKVMFYQPVSKGLSRANDRGRRRCLVR
jgi:hypothetical protein